YNPQDKDPWSGCNSDWWNVPRSPASTFKIPNTLIALETGVVTPETIFKWEEEKRTFPMWEKDMNLQEAFNLSCVPVYQEMARRIGTERMQEYIRLFNYGEMNIDEQNHDIFWLEGTSAITMFQQIWFLRKLYKEELPVSRETMRLTREIMVQEEKEKYRLSAKTGTNRYDGKEYGWYVGYLEKDSGVYFFVLLAEPESREAFRDFVNLRKTLCREIFSLLRVISE
ncbi:MAG: class D beta-lactamase, partial [Bacteroides sp.]|nr:class D beta-lactamase [Bacteroides sp.]